MRRYTVIAIGLTMGLTAGWDGSHSTRRPGRHPPTRRPMSLSSSTRRCSSRRTERTF